MWRCSYLWSEADERVALHKVPGGRRCEGIAYIGWFGPIGIGTIYYAAFARGHTHDPLIWHVASALVFASILIHGLTAAPLTRLYARQHSPSPPKTKHLEE